MAKNWRNKLKQQVLSSSDYTGYRVTTDVASAKSTTAKSASTTSNSADWRQKMKASINDGSAAKKYQEKNSSTTSGIKKSTGTTTSAKISDALAANNPAFVYLQKAGDTGGIKKGSDALVKGTANSIKSPVQIAALGAGDYGASNSTRLDKVINAAVSGSASGYKKLAADLTSSTGNLSMGESARAAINGVNQQEAEAAKRERANNGWVGDLKRNLLTGADESAARAHAYEEQAKEGLGTFGQGVVDFGIAGLQFAGDAALNAIAPGTGLAAMAGRAYGSASQQAKEMGLSEGEQQLSGLKSAAIEVFTEKLFGSVSKVAYGKGIIKNENLVNSLVNRLAKTDKGRTALRVLVGANEEGLEEVLSDILNPIADRVLKLDDGKGDWSDLADDFDVQQMLEDYIIGGALGLMGAGANVMSGQYKAENARQRAYEDYQKQLVNAGLATEQGGAAQTTAEKYKGIVEQSTQRGKRNLSDKETKNLETLIRGTYAQEDASAVNSRLAQLGTSASEQTQKALNETTENTVSENLAKRFGIPQSEVERTYALNKSASPQAFETAFSAMYQMGRNGASRAMIGDIPALTKQQADIAYQMGAASRYSKNEGANNNEVHLRNVAERTGGQNTRGQVRGVAEGTGSNVTGTGGSGQGSYSAVQGKAGEQVVYNGVAQKNVYYYDGEETEDMKKGRELAESYGYKVAYFVGDNIRVQGGTVRGVVDTENKTVMVRADHPDLTPLQIMRHEMGHAAIAKGDFTLAELRQRLLKDFTDTEIDEMVDVYRNAYSGILDADEAFEEICCDALGKINIFAGTKQNSASYVKAQRGIRKYAAEKNSSKGRAPPENGGVKHSIETLPDGRKYVRADRQVIFGNDPVSWSEQLENYINGKIRRGQNVQLIAEDGDVLTLTAKTAGKVASRYRDGKTLSDEEYARKVSAGAHIDELAQVSTRGNKIVPDVDNRHGEMAKDGWNYRTAYFLDFDGKYYRCRISVAISSDGNAVYNIGAMEERSFPTAQKALNGSSANSGALGRKASSEPSVTDNGKEVKKNTANTAEKFSMEAPVEQKTKDVTESQQFKRWFGKSKVTNDDGTPKVVYHATYDDFTVFDRSKLGENTMSNASSWEMGATSLIGHWFSDHDLQDRLGATRLAKCYLNIETPYEISLYDLADDIAAFADNYSELEEAFENGETEQIREVVERYVSKLRSDGYDGLVVNDEEFGGTSYVVFNSEQIKSADPVTYDDNGEVIPLSKRFDSKNEDIRYSREQSKGKEYSGKNVDWAVENGIITEEERISFFHKVADINKLGHKYRQAKNGDYIVDLGGKLLFTNADWYSPSLNIVISFNDSFESSMLYAKEIVFNEAKSEANYNRARQAIETAYWQGYVEFSYSRNYQTNVGKNAGRERADSKANHGKDVNYSREPETLNELRRQNKVLRERVDYWKRQTKPTKVKQLRMDDIRRLAKEVVSMSETDLKPKDITEGLTELGKYLLNEPELRYTDVSKMAEDIAADVIENATAIANEEDTAIHNELRDYLKRVKLRDDGSAEFESIRSSYKRRIMFDKNGLGVDTAYAELHDMFGEGYFPEDIVNPADQLERIAEVLDNTAPKYANPNGYYAKEATEFLRNYIIDSMLGEDMRQSAPTYADKAEAKLAAAKAQSAQKLNEQKTEYDEKISNIKAQNEKRIKKAIAEERQRGEKRLQRFRDSVESRDAKRKKNRYKAQIEKNVKTLSDWLLKPDHKNALKHISGELQSTVRDFIASIDFTSARQLGGGAATAKDMRYLSNLERLHRYITDNNVGEDRYSGYLDLPPNFETELGNFIHEVNALARKNSGYTINDMTVEQLKELSDIVKTMKKTITDMNRMYQNRTFQHAYDAGASDVATLKGYVRTKAFTTNLAANRLDQTVMWEQSRPAHVFRRFGKGGESIYREFADAQGTMAFLTKEVLDFANEAYKSSEVKAWAKETHTFEFGDDTVTLTTAQLMSLYELNKRRQAKQHLEAGGFRVANFKNGRFKLETDKKSHAFTDIELGKMFEKLTDRQKEVADKLQRFMAEKGGAWGNYVSIKRFDVEMFKDENYFPIKVDNGQLDAKETESVDNASLYQLLNMGFAKDVSAKANQALVVYDIFDVFANHMSEMAQYRSFALPVLDAMKWFNYKERNESGVVTASFREEMRRAFGSDVNGRGFAEKFITGVIKAYNGAEGRGENTYASKSLNLMNRQAVAYNTRVMIQQPSAIVRAAMFLNPADLAASLKNYAGITTKTNIEEMHKYSGVAVWKDLGFYDVNVSRGVRELIKNDQGTISRINEIGMKGAGFADKVTWAALWDASKKKVRRETGLNENSEEFYAKVSELFEDVIYNTQVVDTVLTKSEYSRDKRFSRRLFSSFMSEPMTTASLVTSEIFDIQMKQAAGAKLKLSDYSRLSKTCIVVAVAAAVNSALAALADAWRDDDDYGTFGEKWLRAYRVKLADELMPLTYLPYSSTVWDTFKLMLDKMEKKWFGLDVYGNGTDLPISDIIEATTKVVEIFKEIDEKGESSKYTKFGGYYKVVNVISKLTGVPIYNLMREIVAVNNNLRPDSKWKSYEPSAENSVYYAWKDGYLSNDEALDALQDMGDDSLDADKAYLTLEKWKANASSEYFAVYDAIDNNGDIKDAVKDMLDHGKEEGYVKSAITNHYKDAYINGDNAERARIRKALYATGLYGSVNDVIEKCNSWLK